MDRFLELHRRGQMGVAAMSYHWTPMLSPAGMIRSLFPLMRLRQDHGIHSSTAMQCDVNGANWLWADLLPAIDVNSFTMSINMHRGRRPQPDLNAFWWRGPGGGRLLTFNGPHYLYGIFRNGLGELLTTEALLPGQLQALEAHDDYPYDFLYAQVTHPARVDNGPPLPVMRADFWTQGLRGKISTEDQGKQYAALAYRQLLPETTRISMSAAGQPTENALAERFMRTLKEEHVDYTDYRDMDDALHQLEYWLEVEYMTERIHSSLAYRTPAEFEAAFMLAHADSPLTHA